MFKQTYHKHEMRDFSAYKDIVYQIIGASMRVHRVLGYGLLEKVYEYALEIELAERGIPCEREKEIETFYLGKKLPKLYRMDLLIGDIICELKASATITPQNRAQLCNYLRLTRKPLGLLINFGAKNLIGERWAFDAESNSCFLLDVNMHPLDMVDIECDFNDD